MSPADDDVIAFELPTRRGTTRLARHLAPLLRPADLLILDGPLGSGKTFFTRALCRALGLPTVVPVTSPTFTLVHELETTPRLVHADLYRLDTVPAVVMLGLDAFRDDGWILVVEWGAPFVAVLGGDAVVLSLAVEPARRATVRATGARSAEILASLRPFAGVP